MTRRQFASVLASLAASAALPGFTQGPSEERRFRVAVSADTLAGANINDARAAYKAWGVEIVHSFGMQFADMVPEAIVPSDRMLQMVREGSIDCFVITALEYANVVDLIDPECILLQDYAADGLEYVLVVHNASPFQKLEELNNRPIALHHHRDSVLLPTWLNILLADKHLPPIDQFFGHRTSPDLITQVILPVFFRRIDVAGLPRIHFKNAVELNPQLGRDLRILASSPKVVPIAFCFRKDSNTGDKRRFRDAIVKLSTIPAGQQIMELYQSRSFVSKQAFCMQSALDMVRQYQRILARPKSAPRKDRS